MCQPGDLICVIILVLIAVWPPGLRICWQFSTLMIIPGFAKCWLSVSIIFYIDCLEFYAKKRSDFSPVCLPSQWFISLRTCACLPYRMSNNYSLTLAFPILPDFYQLSKCWLFFNYVYLCMFGVLGVGRVHMNTLRGWRCPFPSEAGAMVVEFIVLWVLRTEPGSPVRAELALKGWIISPVSSSLF